MLKYSISKKTFYDTNLNYPNLPTDLVDIEQDIFNKIIERNGDEEFDYKDGEFIIFKKEALSEEILVNNEKYKIGLDIERYYSNIINILTNNPKQEEKDTWNIKLSIANNCLNNSLTIIDEVFFKGANLLSNESQKQWSEKVVNKAKFYASILGAIESLRSSSKAKLKLTNKLEELYLLSEEIKTSFNSLLESLKELS